MKIELFAHKASTGVGKAGLEEIKLVCEQANIASIKTIVNNKGKLIRTFGEGDSLCKEYCIIL